MRIFLLVAVIALTPLISHAAINKCIDAKGKISYQEQPCLIGAAASEIAVKGGSTPVMSEDDKRWVAERREWFVGDCQQTHSSNISSKLVSPAAAREICQCMTTRLFATSVGKLRAMEARKDVGGMKKLMLPISAGCVTEFMEKRQ